MEIGQSQQESVNAITSRYPISETRCEGNSCVYNARVDTAFWGSLYGHGTSFDKMVNRLGELSDAEWSNKIGMRHFFLSASLTVTGRVLRSDSVDLVVEGPCHKWLNAGWHYSSTFPDYLRRPGQKPDSDNLLIRWNHLHWGGEGGEGITAYVTPAATSEEREVAFSLNTNCLTKLGNGCFLLSEIMPDAARWASEHTQGLGWTDQTCHGLKDPDLR